MQFIISVRLTDQQSCVYFNNLKRATTKKIREKVEKKVEKKQKKKNCFTFIFLLFDFHRVTHVRVCI